MNCNFMLLLIILFMLLVFIYRSNSVEKFTTNCKDKKGPCTSELCPTGCDIQVIDSNTCTCTNIP